MGNKKAKFTIIIPTRERCDTLRWCLETCTEQNYDDLEIIVSDNFSQDGTHEVVESNDDKRFRYINTGQRLSMTHNYEFALSHATGDYVTIIGDDDGMITDVLEEIDQIVGEYKPEVLTWDKATYVWPNYYDESERDLLMLPYRRKNAIKKVDAAALLNSIFRFENDFTRTIFTNEFPSIYHSFVSREAINKARSAQGVFFHSRIPDIYSGVALASVVTDFWHSTKPYSVRGASSHSIGAALFSGEDKLKASANAFLQEENIPFHAEMQFCYSLPVMVVESLLQVIDNVPNARKTDFDARILIDTAMHEAAQKPLNIYDDIVKAIEHIGRVQGLEKCAEEAILKHPFASEHEPTPALYGYHPSIKSYIFDGRDIGVENVYDAALYCERVLTDNLFSTFVKENMHFVSNAFKKKGMAKIARKIMSPVIDKFVSAA